MTRIAIFSRRRFVEDTAAFAYVPLFLGPSYLNHCFSNEPSMDHRRDQHGERSMLPRLPKTEDGALAGRCGLPVVLKIDGAAKNDSFRPDGF
jgi:hypothetical protein